MAVPPFHVFLRPVLVVLSDGEARHWRVTLDAVTRSMHLTDADLHEMLPSGTRSRAEDRVIWALTYLRHARLIQPAGRAISTLTERGREYLRAAPDPIKPSDLARFPEFREFMKPTERRHGVDTSGVPPVDGDDVDKTPQEVIADAFAQHTNQLATDVLEQVQQMEPAAFERLIVKLMLRLGYGGLGDESGHTLGRSGDEGVDGAISLDRLGLERIYLQAKRWVGTTVGSKEIQAFVGALTGQGAQKGVFITTSRFSGDARAYQAKLSSPNVSLIDGIELAKLMVEHELGVSVVDEYRVKRVDSDFFAEM